MSDAERERFEAVFVEHFEEVLRFALARTDPDTAKDAVAETFLAAWRGLDKLPANPRGWLMTVTRRKLTDHYRASSRRAVLTTRLATCAPSVEPDLAEGVVELDRVRAAFSQLREPDQEVLQLLAWDGLTRSEAVEVLGCSATTFAVRLHRARRRFREALDDRSCPPDALAHVDRPNLALVAKETS